GARLGIRSVLELVTQARDTEAQGSDPIPKSADSRCSDGKHDQSADDNPESDRARRRIRRLKVHSEDSCDSADRSKNDACERNSPHQDVGVLCDAGGIEVERTLDEFAPVLE